MDLEETQSQNKNSNNNTQENNSQKNDNLNEEELKLLAAKKERLKMEQAASVLENRVLYLEKINSKMNKKIESAKNRAVEIMRLKKHNLESEQMKKRHLESQEVHLKEKQQKIQVSKTEQEDKLNTSKLNSMTNSMIIAKNTKEGLMVT